MVAVRDGERDLVADLVVLPVAEGVRDADAEADPLLAVRVGDAEGAGVREPVAVRLVVRLRLARDGVRVGDGEADGVRLGGVTGAAWRTVRLTASAPGASATASKAVEPGRAASTTNRPA
jgi:hypothetical protein